MNNRESQMLAFSLITVALAIVTLAYLNLEGKVKAVVLHTNNLIAS